LHISEIAKHRVNEVSDELSIGQEVKVKLIDYDKNENTARLSMRALIPGEEERYENRTYNRGGNRRSSGGRSHHSRPRRSDDNNKDNK